MIRRSKISSSLLPLIGWRERVGLPELGIGPIVAKIDTGARSAALHAKDIRIETHGERRSVHFTVPANGRNHHCEMPLIAERHVKNSGGGRELRAVIHTPVEIGRTRVSAEITLTNRTDMGVPMLLGRAAIRGHFLVHPGRAFLVSPKAKKPTA